DDYVMVGEAVRSGRVTRAPADDLTPGIALLAAELAAFEIVRFVAARVSPVTPTLYGAFAEYSLLTHTATVHRVLKLPRCPGGGMRAWGRPTTGAWMEPYEGMAHD